MAAMLLSFREGLEVVLVVGVLLGVLRKLDRYHLARYVWAGVGAALLVSFGLAAALTATGLSLEGWSEQLFEGTTLLLAATLLTGMIFWMRTQGASLRQNLQAGVAEATGTKRRWFGGLSLFAVAFLAVVREGLELALVLAATGFGTAPQSLIVGAALGLAASITIGWLFIGGVVQLDLRRFFNITNILLTLFAAGMVALGVHELVEAGLVPGIVEPIWNVNWLLDESSPAGQLFKTLLGYNADPALAEVLAYGAYLAAVTLGMRLTPLRRPAVTAA